MEKEKENILQKVQRLLINIYRGSGKGGGMEAVITRAVRERDYASLAVMLETARDYTEELMDVFYDEYDERIREEKKKEKEERK